MTRILCLPLLFALTLHVLAQEEPIIPLQAAPPTPPTVGETPSFGQTLPRDPVFLMQMRERVALELQQVQQVLSVINPNDTHLIETLRTQQAELAKQYREITQQMQAGLSVFGGPPGMGERIPGQFQMDAQVGRTPPIPPTMPHQGGLILPATPQPMQPGQFPGQPIPPASPPIAAPPLPTVPNLFYPPSPSMPLPGSVPYGVPDWNNQGAASWGTRLSEELTETRQVVESLKREVADLTELVKALEGQIRLLNQNILLSERVRENGN